MTTGDKALRIFIVEDDKSAAVILRRMLEKSSSVIVGVTDTGEDAIAKAEELKPDIMLMDIGLVGNIDGVLAAEEIYGRFNIPVIYITGGVDDETFQRAKKSMPFGYILKPFNQNILISTIEIGWYRFQAEQKLHESEKRNKDILSTIPDVMFTITKDGKVPDEIQAEISSRIWPARIAGNVLDSVRKAIEEDHPEAFEYELKRTDRLLYYEARIIRADSESALVIVRDVTERKMAELEVAEYRETLERKVEERTEELSKINKDLTEEVRLRQLSEESLKIFGLAFNQNPNYAIICDSTGVVEFVNNKFIEMSGYTQNELIGQNVTKQDNPLLPEPETWKYIESTPSWKGEVYGISKEGGIYYGLASVSRVLNEKGNVQHYVIFAEDITQKKKEQKEIERISERLDSSRIEQINMEMDWRDWKEKMMSRNITRTDKSLFRNINNSFTQGAGFGSLISLLEMLSVGAEESEDWVRVDKSVYRLVKDNVLIAQTAFKMFSNIDWIIQNDFELEKVSFRELYNFIRFVIGHAREFCAIKQQSIIINDYNSYFDRINVNINREYLDKAVFEVLINALKFSRSNSFIIVLVGVAGANAKVSVVNDPVKGEDDILGIPVEYEKVIFEPFFRLSKLVFELYRTLDFGLGLTMVEKIVNKHGGETTARNVLDHSDPKRDPQIKVDVSISLPIIKE